MKDLIIIGGGTAGMTAGLYAVRSGLSVMIFDKAGYGGQIISTAKLENYPSKPNTSGLEFAQDLYDQIIEAGVEFIFDEITKVDFKGRVKTVYAGSGNYSSKAIIIATGSSPKEIDANRSMEFKGRGISYCVSCDGAFYKDKKVAVVGGGNSAIAHALELSEIAKIVYVIHRRKEFRAESSNTEKMFKKGNIKMVTDSVVTDINGSNKIESITVQNIKSQEKKDISLDGVFVSIGAVPQNELYKDILELDEYGYIIANENCNTAIDGVFVAGDCRKKSLRQLVTATADGAISATEARHYLLNIE